MDGTAPRIVTLDTGEPPLRTVRLTFCEVRHYGAWAWTQFPDGSGWGAYPDGGADYAALAARLGYPDPMAYCFEHEFAHSFVEQEVSGRPSGVLWALAHGRKAPDSTAHEEALAQAFQAFLRGVLPMTATSPHVHWYRLRDKALALLEASPWR
jgi:hypothetical protein